MKTFKSEFKNIILVGFISIALFVSSAVFAANNVYGETKRLSIIDAENVTTDNLPQHIRIAGDTRIETSLEAAEIFKKSENGLESVVLASADAFADALSGGILCKAANAPMLLINAQNTKKVCDFIKSEMTPNGTVYILGGTKAVPNVERNELRNFNCKRLGGYDRYDTNALILRQAINELKFGEGTEKQLLVCSGNGYADALSASGIGLPVMIVDERVSKKQLDLMRELDIKNATIIGGTKSVSEAAEKSISNYVSARVYGATRFDTSFAVAEHFFAKSQKPRVILVLGTNFPDGLSAAGLSKGERPVLLIEDQDYGKAKEYVDLSKSHESITFGGKGLISDETIRKIFSDTVGEDNVATQPTEDDIAAVKKFNENLAELMSRADTNNEKLAAFKNKQKEHKSSIASALKTVEDAKANLLKKIGEFEKGTPEQAKIAAEVKQLSAKIAITDTSKLEETANSLDEKAKLFNNAVEKTLELRDGKARLLQNLKEKSAAVKYRKELVALELKLVELKQKESEMEASLAQISEQGASYDAIKSEFDKNVNELAAIGKKFDELYSKLTIQGSSKVVNLGKVASFEEGISKIPEITADRKLTLIFEAPMPAGMTGYTLQLLDSQVELASEYCTKDGSLGKYNMRAEQAGRRTAKYTVELMYRVPDDSAYEKYRAFIKEWVQNNISDEDSELEKINKIRNHMLKEYDYARGYDKDSLEFKDTGMSIFSPIAFITNGKGVCQAYALYFRDMAKLAKLDARYIVGYGGGELHAWNAVKVDNTWYCLDITWDDTGMGGKDSMAYFLRGTNFFHREHQPMYKLDITLSQTDFVKRAAAIVTHTEVLPTPHAAAVALPEEIEVIDKK